MTTTPIINPERVKGYEKTRTTGSDGKVRTVTSNGDAVALAMAGMLRPDLEKVVKANGLTDKMAKHTDKNEGMYRMNLGNMLRARVRNLKDEDKPVVIGKHEIRSLYQRIEVPEAPAPKPRAPKAEKPTAAATKPAPTKKAPAKK